MSKRFICVFTSVLLALLPLLGCAEGFTMAGYDGEDSYHDWNTNGFFTRMEEATGISFTFQEYRSAAEWSKFKTAMLNGGELPDVLFKACLTTSDMIAMTEKGILIDLAPLLEENCPNLWALLQEHPDWLDAVTLPNGSIAALPALQEVGPQDAIWINKAWLDALHLDMPRDKESLKEVLTAFRDKDPNGNGKKDEIPMTFLGPWELKFFSHAWGVVANDYNVYLDSNGQVQYWPADEHFFEMAAWLRELYAEKLLDNSGFMTADSLRQITSNDAALTYGMFLAPTPMNLVTYEMSASFAAMAPLEHDGKQIYRDLFGQVTRGTFAITSACSDPSALLRWVDTLYTEEGAITAMSGVEGKDYIMEDDGYWNWPGGVDSNTSSILNELTIYDSGDMPWLFPQDYYEHYEDKTVRSINTELHDFNTYCVRPFPYYSLTDEQSAQAAVLQSKLGPYVDEMLANMVLGKAEISAEARTAFIDGLNENGMQDMIAFWQNIADSKSAK